MTEEPPMPAAEPMSQEIVERLRELLAKASEPRPAPVPEQDSRVGEAGAARQDQVNYQQWRERTEAARTEIVNALPALLSTLTNLTPSGVERIPSGYAKLPDGVRCRCIRLWRHADGSHWCCQAGNRARALALPSEPPQPISSKKLIALLDDPRIAAAVNDRGAYGKAASEPPRQVCPHCNDTGDVHRADGEWLGKCDCGAQPPSQGDVEGRAREMLATQVYDKLPKKGREPYYSLSAIRLILDTARGFTTGTCHACSYDNADREWPLRLDTGVRGALEAASRLIQQMDRDKAWISADVSAVIGQIAETLASKEDGRS